MYVFDGNSHRGMDAILYLNRVLEVPKRTKSGNLHKYANQKNPQILIVNLC